MKTKEKEVLLDCEEIDNYSNKTKNEILEKLDADGIENPEDIYDMHFEDLKFKMVFPGYNFSHSEVGFLLQQVCKKVT